MILWQHLYLFVFLLGAVLSLGFTPVFQKIAEKTDFMDRPKCEDHKKHAKATPLLGGAAMFSAWILAIILGYVAINAFNSGTVSKDLGNNISGVNYVGGRVFFICLGAFLATALGLLDDKFALNAGTKFLGQFVIAAVAVSLGGIKISVFFNNPAVIWCISVFWIMLLINAINFFDNMDGLAVGTVTIAMALFTAVAAMNGQYFIAVFGALTCGICVGFWFFNHSPATIFMGDSGSHLLGYLLAVMSASVTYFSRDYSLTRFPILIPLFILAIPLFDTFSVVVIRLYHHKPIYIGDHNHLSHRFVKMGMSRKRAVQMVHLMALIIGLSVLPLLWGDYKIDMVILSQAMLMLLFMSLIQYAVYQDHRKTTELDQTTAEKPETGHNQE
ncbi:MAG: MraY family glycosyltransferase [Victivallaceae bacterium]|jgi:UDP-GlcNAc:undecaprenyl-phosphate GlcNAc-1-phosphate transferase